MYDKILVTLDTTPTDRTIIEHVKALAKFMHSRVVLLHVADGWAARTFGPDAVSAEVTEDTAYLQKVKAEFEAAGIPAEADQELRLGGHEHSRAPVRRGPLSRVNLQTGAPQRQRAGASAQGKMILG